jgi:homospermidine synthase
MVGWGANSRVVILGFGCVVRTTFPLIQRLVPNLEYVLVDREAFTERNLITTRRTPVTCLQRTFAPGNIASVIDDVIRDGDFVSIKNCWTCFGKNRITLERKEN